MAIYLYIDTKLDNQIATTLGWFEVGEWIKDKEKEWPQTRALWLFGVSLRPKLVREELIKLEEVEMPNDIKSVLVALLDTLEGHRDAQLIMITNGVLKVSGNR